VVKIALGEIELSLTSLARFHLTKKDSLRRINSMTMFVRYR
jgi:hypothetical protein